MLNKEVERFLFDNNINIDTDGGPCLIKRLSGCGAGYEYLAVAPNGYLYPQHWRLKSLLKKINVI